jgi:hypothetical protein
MFARKAKVLVVGIALTASLTVIQPRPRERSTRYFQPVERAAITRVVEPTVAQYLGHGCAAHNAIFQMPAAAVFTTPLYASPASERETTLFVGAHAVTHTYNLAGEIALDRKARTAYEVWTAPPSAMARSHARTRRRSE